MAEQETRLITPEEARQRTAPAAAKADRAITGAADTVGKAFVRGGELVTEGAQDIADTVGDVMADPPGTLDKAKKKTKGFFDGMSMPGILGSLLIGLGGAWFLGGIFGDMFGGGILSTILTIGLAFLLVPIGYDIANGMFGKDKKTPALPIENQPQRFTTPQVQQLLEKADAPGMKHDVLQVIKAPGQKLTLAPVPEGATVDPKLLITRAKIEQDMAALADAGKPGDFFLLPKADGSYDFGTVPPVPPEKEKPKARPQARGRRQGDVEPPPASSPRRERVVPAPRADASDTNPPPLPIGLSQDAINAMLEHAREAGKKADGVEIYQIAGSANTFGVRPATESSPKAATFSKQTLDNMYGECTAKGYQPGEIAFVPDNGKLVPDCVAPRAAGRDAPRSRQ